MRAVRGQILGEHHVSIGEEAFERRASDERYLLDNAQAAYELSAGFVMVDNLVFAERRKCVDADRRMGWSLTNIFEICCDQ